ncbi:uncharacterized protein LOC122539010 [Frieseomelitta varia]|uniref:uncharacterized protein LOC122539010 n=1 Tax=Frieseomelitta varia TaxID=561572 RepID=UPI001CB69B86|nr:uncharacterized protein LOC122539010 [Frieseomelitta varia]
MPSLRRQQLTQVTVEIAKRNVIARSSLQNGRASVVSDFKEEVPRRSFLTILLIVRRSGKPRATTRRRNLILVTVENDVSVADILGSLCRKDSPQSSSSCNGGITGDNSS